MTLEDLTLFELIDGLLALSEIDHERHRRLIAVLLEAKNKRQRRKPNDNQPTA